MSGIPHPIHLAPPHEGVVPHSYMIWKHYQLCSNCNTMHTWCEVFAKTHLAPNMHRGKYITNLRPLSEPPMYNLPVELREEEMKRVPFCHDCDDPGQALKGLPFPPSPDPPPAPPSWVGTGPSDRLRPKAPKPKATLDDLMDLIPQPRKDPE